MKHKLLSLSAANPFIAIDGLMDMKKIQAVAAKIRKEIAAFKPAVVYGKSRSKEFPVVAKLTLNVKTKKEANAVKSTLPDNVAEVKLTGESGKFVLTFQTTDVKAAKSIYASIVKLPGLAPAPTHYYVVGAKAKVVKPDARKFKNKDASYLAKRAVKAAQRKRMTAKAVELLPVYGKGVLSKSMQAQMLAAERAINSHINKAVKVKELVTKIRGKAREERAAEFGTLVESVRPLLESAGIKEANIVQSSGIGGASLLVTLPNKQVMSIGLSTPIAFKAARKAAAEAAE